MKNWCLVFESNNWHRAEITFVDGHSCSLQLLDSGKRIVDHPYTELLHIPFSVKTIPALASNVRLEGITKANNDDEWYLFYVFEAWFGFLREYSTSQKLAIVYSPLDGNLNHKRRRKLSATQKLISAICLKQLCFKRTKHYFTFTRYIAIYSNGVEF